MYFVEHENLMMHSDLGNRGVVGFVEFSRLCLSSFALYLLMVQSDRNPPHQRSHL